MKIDNPFLQFLQYCLDDALPLPDNVSRIDWRVMLTFAEQQAIVGVICHGILRAGKSISMPFDVLMAWVGYANRIEVQNKILNQRCVEVVANFRKDGYECCVLKGQGNAAMYPNPCSRTPGDIDVWLSGGRKKILSYVRQKYANTILRYHHVEYPIFKEVPVEIHFMPFFANNPVFNRRLQRWFRKEEQCQFSNFVDMPNKIGSIPVPTNYFNVVYQLLHMMHHFFDEGIGLRQMIDYYYLLRNAKDNVGCQITEVRETLKCLNLNKFSGAVMYIMKEVLGLGEEYLIVPVDERRGKTLLNEILKGGNFGHSSGLDQNNMAKKYLQKTWRNMHFVREYPAEALCEPVFRTWHFFWRQFH